MRVCVYCSSSNLIDSQYLVDAETLGSGIAQRGWELVYGGGSVGLMGRVARAAHANGGRVFGVITQALLDREVGYRDADELIVTLTMRERKQRMDERATAFVTLPGGFGTLEELAEIITLRQLGYHDKPIVLVNSCGFFDPLLAQFERYFEGEFTAQQHRRLYTVAEDAAGALRLLE